MSAITWHSDDSDITWRLTEADARDLLEAVNEMIEMADDDSMSDRAFEQLQRWSQELTSLLEQRRLYLASIQPGLAGLA